MAKKKINIILLVVVFCVWGTAGYRYLSNFFTKKSLQAISNPKPDIKFKDVKRDTFVLAPLPVDPFLHHALIVGKPQKSSKFNNHYQKKISVQKIAAVTSAWPDLHYYGFIQSQNKNQVVLIKIDNTLFKIHKGEIVNGICVKEIYKDSVSIIFNKERKIFKHI